MKMVCAQFSGVAVSTSGAVVMVVGNYAVRAAPPAPSIAFRRVTSAKAIIMPVTSQFHIEVPSYKIPAFVGSSGTVGFAYDRTFRDRAISHRFANPQAQLGVTCAADIEEHA
jgi:hypothetical protein